MLHRPRMGVLAGLAVALALVGCAQSHTIESDCGLDLMGRGEPLCDPGALRAALAGARAGDVVRIGACRVMGPLELPAGVILVGSGRVATTISAASDSALVVHGGTGGASTRVSCLGIDVASGGTGVRVTGPGSASLDGLALDVARGIGIDVRDLATFRASDVRLEGPVTRENAMALSPMPTPMDSGTVALSVARVTDSSLTNVEVSGFADFGVVASQSQSVWRAVEVHDMVGTALAISGGTAMLDGVDAIDVLRGTRLLPSYGLVVAMDANVRSTALTIEGSEGYGVLQDSATSEHRMLTVVGSAEAGMWVQHSAGLTLDGAELRENGGAGLALFEVEHVSVTNTTVSGTEMRTRVCDLRTGQVGDGVQLRGVPDAMLVHLIARDNARVGVLLQLPTDGSVLPRFTDVSVSGVGDQLGAVAVDRRGNVTSPSGWDTGIARAGAAVANDPAALGTMMSPPCTM